MKHLKILSIAAASGRIGYVFFVGRKMTSWGISRKASKTPALAAEKTQQWIKTMNPDVVVSEKITKTSTKGERSKSLISAILRTASEHYLLDVAVKREQAFQNKYLEAQALAKEFPEIQPWVPKKPRIWQTEPRNTIYFEALALAKVILNGPTPVLVRAT